MKRSALIRLIILVVLVVLLVLLGAYTSLGEWFVLENVTSAIRKAGVWGALVFVVLCCVGSFLQLPAMLFVFVAILVYDQWVGTAIGYGGLIIAMIANFYFARLVGGRAFEAMNVPFIQKILAKLDDHPIRTVILLRLILWASPPLNFALAMTKLKPVNYIVGSLIGSVIPVMIFSLLVLFFRSSIIPWMQ